MRRSFHTVRERRMLRRIKRIVAHAAEPPRIPGPDIAGPGAEPSSVTGGADSDVRATGRLSCFSRIYRIWQTFIQNTWKRGRKMAQASGYPPELARQLSFSRDAAIFLPGSFFCRAGLPRLPPKERPRTEESSTSCSFHDNAARPRQESPCAYSSSVREGASMPLPGN